MNQSRGAVLAEPFPCLMSQRVILLLIKYFNEICGVEVDMSTEFTTLEPCRVRLQVASIFALVKNDEKSTV